MSTANQLTVTRPHSLAARALLFLLLAFSLVAVNFRPAAAVSSLVSSAPFRSQNEHEELPHDGEDGGKASGGVLVRAPEQRRLLIPRPSAHGLWWAAVVAESPLPSRPREPADVPLPHLDFVASSLGLRAPPSCASSAG